MKKFFLLLLLILYSYALPAQECTVSGTVTDIWNNPLIGVEVYLEKHPEVGTFTNGDGAYTLSVSGIDCHAIRLTFVYCDILIGNIATEGRSIVDLKDVHITYYEYLTTISIMLRGSVVRMPFGAGVEFYDDRLWNKWFNARGESTYYGYVAYHTNFSENSEIHAQLYKKPLYRNGLMVDMSFDRYVIPKLETDMDCYHITIGRTTQPQLVAAGFEYVNRRYGGQKDEMSVIAGWNYFYHRHHFFVNAGISQHATPRVNIGAVTWQSREIPFSAEISAGYWLGEWKWDIGLKRHFKYLSVSIGYAHLFGDDNGYLKVMVPIYKSKTIEIEK